MNSCPVNHPVIELTDKKIRVGERQSFDTTTKPLKVLDSATKSSNELL